MNVCGDVEVLAITEIYGVCQYLFCIWNISTVLVGQIMTGIYVSLLIGPE